MVNLKVLYHIKDNKLNGISKLYYEDGKLQRKETNVNLDHINIIIQMEIWKVKEL